MDAMLKDLLSEFNSEISKSHITYSDTKLKISIETVERNADGSVKDNDPINEMIRNALRPYWALAKSLSYSPPLLHPHD